jgi:hypothetical protein
LQKKEKKRKEAAAAAAAFSFFSCSFALEELLHICIFFRSSIIN